MSGSADTLICLWDIAAGNKSHTTLPPLRTYQGHTAGVCDVSYHPLNASMFGSVADDATLRLWDARTDGKAQHVRNKTMRVLCSCADVHAMYMREYVVDDGFRVATCANVMPRCAALTCAIFQLLNIAMHVHVHMHVHSHPLHRRLLVFALVLVSLSLSCLCACPPHRCLVLCYPVLFTV